MIDGEWDSRFGPKTKLLLIDALIRMTLAREMNEATFRRGSPLRRVEGRS
ncbi:MAG: hypothetical protein ACRDSP_16160 [Pseudonocardiaceae bacterium]